MENSKSMLFSWFTIISLTPRSLITAVFDTTIANEGDKLFIGIPSNKSWGQRVWVQGYNDCIIMTQSEVGNSTLLM